MGEGQSKSGSQPVYNRNIDKFELDVALQDLKYTAEIQQGRRKGELNAKEKELKALIAKEKPNRDRIAEFEKARSICNDQKIIRAFSYLQTYCGILKDHQMDIVNSRGDPNKIKELIPFVESILWGCQKLNLKSSRFLKFLTDSFGLVAAGELSKSTNVIKEIHQCFETLNPTDFETRKYMVEFCNKNSFDVECLNELGHNIILNSNGEVVETLDVGIKVETITSNIGGPKDLPPPSGFNGIYPGPPGGGFPSGGNGIPYIPGYNMGYPQQQMNIQPQPTMTYTYQQPITIPPQGKPGLLIMPTYPQGQPMYQQPQQQYPLPPYAQPQQFNQMPTVDPNPVPYPDFNGINMLKPQNNFGPSSNNGSPTTPNSNIAPPVNSSLDEFTLRMKNIKEGL